MTLDLLYGMVIFVSICCGNTRRLLHGICKYAGEQIVAHGPLVYISHSNIMHREICVKSFSGTTAPRILKFDANIAYDYLYCVRENQHPDAYHFLYLSIFFSFSHQ